MMKHNDQYIATLDQLQQDLREAENAQKAAVQRVDHIQAAIKALAPLVTYQASLTLTAPPVVISGNGGAAQMPSTMKDWAVFAFKRSAGPMKVRDLYEAMIRLGYQYEKPFETFRGSMTPTLDRDSDVFEKVAPGLYRLRQTAEVAG